MSQTARILTVATMAAYLVAGAGLAAAITTGMFLWVGEPWGRIINLALLVMTLAIAPLMLAFYELGGWTPTPLARAAQALGWLAVLTWSVLHALVIAGAVRFDIGGLIPYAIWAGTLAIIGSWVAGANLLAGPWLGWVRWLGVASGIGLVVLGMGRLLGGTNEPIANLGGIAYQVGVPIWALLIARELGGHLRDQRVDP